MAQPRDLRFAEGGRLAENILHFGRLLRKAGLPVGPGHVLDAIDAAQCGCLGTRGDFFWALHAVFVKRRDHEPIFRRAFEVFWRQPKLFERLMSMLMPQITASGEARKRPGDARLAGALFAGSEAARRNGEIEPRRDVELDARLTFSAEEVLRTKDFEQMTAEEQEAGRRLIARLRLERRPVASRRFRPAERGTRIDMRRTLRASLASGADVIDLKRRERRHRDPPLVVLCDISGSMSGYTRMFLHFLHALFSDRDRVHVFLFGTRLTNITRELKRRDVDEALERVAGTVKDWSGGTRIGAALREFNFRWGRRVLAQGAHVLLISDGLDRENVDLLEAEMKRLRRSARRIIWLNPLLRFEGFEAKANGVRAILPHVDEFRPVHNLASLEDLAGALAYSRVAEHDPRRWLAQANGKGK